MAITRTWKVYGAFGHRQAVSFQPSFTHDFSSPTAGTRILSVECSDKTGTNEYVILHITRDTVEACEDELWGQVTDGIFENCTTGLVEEIHGGINMTLADAEKILDESNTYWAFEESGCCATYFTWSEDERLGYISEHYFLYDYLATLDQEAWKDTVKWSNVTFGNAFSCPTYLTDVYDEESLIYHAKRLDKMIKLTDEQAMNILEVILTNNRQKVTIAHKED